MTKFTIKKITTETQIEAFWQKRKEYEERDIFPNLTADEIAWFQSEEYYDIIMTLHQQAKGARAGLQFAFFYNDSDYLGFTMYKIYTHEDGKAFIMDYCIEPAYRNQGLGAEIYIELERLLQQEGALFCELNSSDQGAPASRFWERQGFMAKERDEHGIMTYVKMW